MLGKLAFIQIHMNHNTAESLAQKSLIYVSKLHIFGLRKPCLPVGRQVNETF